MAHKKAAGAAKNLRDSQPKYRGIKIFGGQKAVAWNIIVRQNGSKYECGANTYLASDFSIHASIDGIVMFKKKNFKRFDWRTYLKTVVYVDPIAEIKSEKKASSKSEKAPAKKVTTKKEEDVEVKVEVKAEEKETAKVEKKAPAKKTTTTKKATTTKTSTTKAPAKKAATKKEEKAD